MNISQFFKLFAVGFPALIVADLIWLGFIMRNTYHTQLAHIARLSDGSLQVNWLAGLLVWALIVIGAIVLVLPHVQPLSLVNGFLWGAFYGLVLYGVYDLTNYALLAQWPLSITFIDIAWGAFVNGMLVMLLTWVKSFL